jgi:glyoxylase-like metal-dependent hydrolase (beta-lactamase superfamily II)
MTMTTKGGGEATLAYKTLIKRRPSATQGIPPGKEGLAWVANTVTLIYGQQDACLVDTFLFKEHAAELVEWVAQSGRNLTTIYVTHGHADHFFGLAALLERFPRARAIATPEVVAIMRKQIEPEYLESFWEKRFPGYLPSKLVVAEPLIASSFTLEGHELKVVNIGHTDTDGTTCLHVPAIDLVVSGDAVYNGIHPYLVESNESTRREWLKALDTIEALKPRAVIAGHRIPDGDDSPIHIGETRKYIQDFVRLNAGTTTARELYDAMLALYPDRVNPGSLWGSARSAKATS